MTARTGRSEPGSTADSYPRVRPQGDDAVVVEFGDRIDPDVNGRVLGFCRVLAEAPPRGVVEVIPTFRSALLRLDPPSLDEAQLDAALDRAMGAAVAGVRPPRRTVRLPVVYGGQFGPDLDAVASKTGLTPAEVITLHSGTSYDCYMVGFTLGFPYLGTVPEALAVPRLATPRVRVPAGSMGIAGRQTGIYPVEAPGGWNLIGRTPVNLWRMAEDPPCLVRPGDRVEFFPVPPDAWDHSREELVLP